MRYWSRSMTTGWTSCLEFPIPEHKTAETVASVNVSENRQISSETNTVLCKRNVFMKCVKWQNPVNLTKSNPEIDWWLSAFRRFLTVRLSCLSARPILRHHHHQWQHLKSITQTPSPQHRALPAFKCFILKCSSHYFNLRIARQESRRELEQIVSRGCRQP